MSRLPFRVFLSVLISLVLILGIFMSVQAASLFGSQARTGVGTYVLSGSLVRPFQVQTTNAVQTTTELQSNYYSGDGGGGHECESESRVNPEE